MVVNGVCDGSTSAAAPAPRAKRGVGGSGGWGDWSGVVGTMDVPGSVGTADGPEPAFFDAVVSAAERFAVGDVGGPAAGGGLSVVGLNARPSSGLMTSSPT